MRGRATGRDWRIAISDVGTRSATAHPALPAALCDLAAGKGGRHPRFRIPTLDHDLVELDAGGSLRLREAERSDGERDRRGAPSELAPCRRAGEHRAARITHCNLPSHIAGHARNLY